MAVENVFVVIEGLLEHGQSDVDIYSKIKVPDTYPLFQGDNIASSPIELYSSRGKSSIVIIQNESDWHCYHADNLVAERRNHKLYVDGKLSEYKYDYSSKGSSPTAQTCTNTLVQSYQFENAVMKSDLTLEESDTVVYADPNGSRPLSKSFFIMSRYAQQLADNFGKSWVGIQGKYIIRAAREVGQDLFSVSSNGKVSLVVDDALTSQVYDFTQLDKDSLLHGTLWDGIPGSADAASENWCKIVNMPMGVSAKAIQYQTVIGTNCARSTPRYCDNVGTYPASAPVGWDDDVAQSAQKNSDMQYKKDKQGHYFVQDDQNVFVLHAKSAITPIIGYYHPREDGKVNNAGKLSWAGHEGHCQNVMSKEHVSVGMGYKPTKPVEPDVMSYWTQDLGG
ncbi:CAP domain-containing protein [Vibrio mediterranei]|uniref:CAP domain-containing protein n=1 Tax=Vibrio mediterranei TaxID=689 RepID=UPI001EFE64DD|nr:CAP domain-containing protein [Vibrio mediterranei]MCG9660341.1 CAP domain-containing protein [Vibrio mediterranei]